MADFYNNGNVTSGRLTGGNFTILLSSAVKLLRVLEDILITYYFTHAFYTTHVSYANRMLQGK
jgi:hypothetical protein